MAQPLVDPYQIFDLRGRTALVTGVGPGMGTSVAKAYAAAGANVVLCARSADRVHQVAREIEESGGHVTGMVADVSKPEDLARLIDTCSSTYGGVDIIYNNAHGNPITFSPGPDGQMVPSTECLDMSTELWQICFDVNVLAPFRLTQLAFPIMQKRGGGSIINILSDQAFSPTMTAVIGYGATKGALHTLTRFLAKECAPTVRVNALNPGAMTDDADVTPDVFASLVERIPLQRVGAADEIVGAALFLASDASSYMTGELLRVDGGRLHASG
jgi:NAD(P)-dependent dehydrogenase (short-subunit alcohol dehydrogenase family)